MQELAEEERMEFSKVDGRENPADVFTKNLGAQVVARHLGTMGMVRKGGRADTALVVE